MSTLNARPPWEVHHLTLGDVLRENRRRYPQHLALVCGDFRVLYPELDDRVNRLASALLSAGVGVGDRLVWAGQNCHRTVELLLAAAKIGANLCPVNWRLATPELAFIIDDFDPVLIFWNSAEIEQTLRSAREQVSTAAPWIPADAEGGEDYEAFLAGGDNADDELEVDSASSVLTIYTAAFTGRPNGALLSHNGLVQTSLLRGLLTGIDDDYRYLNTAPFFHIGNWAVGTIPTLLFGGTNVLLRRWNPREAAALVEREGCNGLFAVASMMSELREAAAEQATSLDSLRDIADVFTRVSGYGQTETHGIASFRAFARDAQGGNGRTSPLLQLRLLDDDGNEVRNGSVGEICVRGPAVFNGYHNRPELNARRIGQGWWRTNDLGRREADGTLTFVATKSRMLKSAAENIYPAEVESVLLEHPAVLACAVIGVPDEKWIQSCKAIVQLRPGASATAEELIEHCRRLLASYKKPRTVQFVDELPRKGTAIDFATLNERFGGGAYPGGSTRSH